MPLLVWMKPPISWSSLGLRQKASSEALEPSMVYA